MSRPVVEPPRPSDENPGRDEGVHVAGVVLAAGRGSRYDDGNKLLATVDGSPVVRHAVETVRESPVEDVTVVLGYESGRVRKALDGLVVEFVNNPQFEAGQSTSVRVGVEATPQQADAMLVYLGDMPFVSSRSVTDLLGAYRAGYGDALAAAYEGQRGNPVVFDRTYFEALAAVEGDVGGRKILTQEGVLVETGDPGVIHDVDRPADLDPSFR